MNGGLQESIMEFSPILDYSEKKFEFKFLEFSVEEPEFDVRPDYYKQTERQIYIDNLILPVFISGSKSMKSMKFELFLNMSNRTSKLYIDSHSNQILDVLYSDIESITPDFPLLPEGKIIIKDRIKMILNDFLKKNKVEGYVEEINLSSVLGG